MLFQFLTEPEGFLKHIRRYFNAPTTTMVFGWRTPTYEDEKMMQLFNGFSEFADLNQTGTTAMIDFFPWLRKLPEFLRPAQQKAKNLHKKEKALYLSHWLRAKEEVQQNNQAMLLRRNVQNAERRRFQRRPSSLYLWNPPRSRLRHYIKHIIRLRSSHATVPRCSTQKPKKRLKGW